VHHCNHTHITQPNCDVSFANGELHQAYSHMPDKFAANETSQLGTYILRLVALYEYDYRI